MRKVNHFTDNPETIYIKVVKTIIITPKISRKSSNNLSLKKTRIFSAQRNATNSFFYAKTREFPKPNFPRVKIRKCKKMRNLNYLIDYPETIYIKVIKTIIITHKTSRQTQITCLKRKPRFTFLKQMLKKSLFHTKAQIFAKTQSPSFYN